MTPDPENFDIPFYRFISNLSYWAPDGIVEIDLTLLHSYGLLKCKDSSSDITRALTDYFHVVESPEKITLYNQRFVIWIVPKVIGNEPTTITLVALINSEETPQIEIVFSTKGIYNSPRLILKILEYYLKEIEENENLIAKINY